MRPTTEILWLVLAKNISCSKFSDKRILDRKVLLLSSEFTIKMDEKLQLLNLDIVAAATMRVHSLICVRLRDGLSWVTGLD